MSKKIMILPIALLGLGLAACGPEEPEAVLETEESVNEALNEVEETEEDSQTEAQEAEEEAAEEAAVEADETEVKYQDLLDQAKREYEAEELEAASGTLSLLLQNDLSDYSEINAEAEQLKEEIHAIQAENAREAASAQTEESAYTDERQSAIISEEYSAATGQSIQDATDEELAEWFTLKESETELEEDSESWTKEEAENYAFDYLIMNEDLNYEDYFFFVNMMEEDWVQLEVRESVDQDGVTWSNLIGIYRFNVSSDELQKLDMVTGDYQTVQ